MNFRCESIGYNVFNYELKAYEYFRNIQIFNTDGAQASFYIKVPLIKKYDRTRNVEIAFILIFKLFWIYYLPKNVFILGFF